MHIISDFQDYYDIGLSLGIDKALTFVRKTEYSNGEALIPNLKAKTGWRKPSWRDLVCSKVLGIPSDFNSPVFGVGWATPNSSDLEAFFVGFCGKFYPLLRYRTKFGPDIETEYDYLYSESDVIEALDKSPFNHTRYRGRVGHGYFTSHGKTDFELALMFIRKGPIEKIEPFVELKAPILLLKLTTTSSFDSPLEINPVLKELKFFRCIDPYMAFQEVSMFIGGVLGVGEPDTLQISDTDMRDAKGFDERSFKTPPGKKRRKKK